MAIPARQDVSLEQRHRREILEYQRRVDQESLRRASVMAATNESERGMANDDEPEGPSPDDAQERRIAEQEDVHDKMHFMLHALDVRRNHIKQAENHLAEEKRTKPTLWHYKFVFLLAIGKDLVDLSIIAALPVISFIVTSIFGIAIFVALYLAKTNRSLFEIRRIAAFIVGYIVEAFFSGVNLFPVQTATVVLIYMIDILESNDKIAKAIQLVENIADLKHKK